MKTLKLFILLLIASMLMTACFAPVNSTFESAKMLDKGDVGLHGNYSKYYGFAWLEGGYMSYNDNLGFGLDYGVNDRFNMKLRYEQLSTKASFELLGEEFSLEGLKLHYVELGSKFQIMEDKMALSVPLGIYFVEGEAIYSIDPRFFFTLGNSKTFEFNITPKAHIILGEDAFAMPGINLGFGFSSNLDKWAIRPEFGFDGALTFGVGVSYYMRGRE